MGMTSEPDRDDPVQVYADRAIKALQQEFKDDAQIPRFAVVVETPPEGHVAMVGFLPKGGRIGIASDGDDAIDVHRLFALGAASVRNAMSPEVREKAREIWDLLRAGFESLN